jgi:hypothetical protein
MESLLNASAQGERKNQSDTRKKTASRKAASAGGVLDDRPAAVTQRALQDVIDNSRQVLQHKAVAEMINNSAGIRQHKAQRDAIQRSPGMAARRLQSDMLVGVAAKHEKFNPSVQRQQRTSATGDTSRVSLPTDLAASSALAEVKRNNTGLPDRLKSGMESMSGMSLDHVKVHYNSSRPAQLNAHAYAQGGDIHVGPGQEKYLSHEAWHVVQQAQGRVRPTMQMQGGVQVNDDKGLEAEADAMGARALQLASTGTSQTASFDPVARRKARSLPTTTQAVLKAQFAPVQMTKGVKRKSGAAESANAYTANGNPGPYKQIKTSVDGSPIGPSMPHVLGDTFEAGGITFPVAQGGVFSEEAALRATKAKAGDNMASLTGHRSKAGVKVGDVGSYKAIQHLEQKGDQLTGDHQPSGAAIKQAIRQQLHAALNVMLTRGMANTAYGNAITVVMTDAWHKAESRTYGGRNSQTQIHRDANDLLDAAMKDWKKTVPELIKQGYTPDVIQQIWRNLEAARNAYYEKGAPQMAALQTL